MQVTGANQTAVDTATTQTAKQGEATSVVEVKEAELTEEPSKTMQSDVVTLSSEAKALSANEAKALSGSGGGYWPEGDKP